MSYTPNPTWHDLPDETTPITASTLNHIEAGIEAAATAADAATATAGGTAATVAGYGDIVTHDTSEFITSSAGLLESANNLSDVANTTTARNNLGAQAADADLTTIAALNSAATGVIASDGTGWVSKTVAQFRTWLGLATVAITGAYSDLTGKPTLGTLAAVTPTGTPTGSKFLRDDDVWAVPAGGTTLPSNAIGYLVNDGAGALSWAGALPIVNAKKYGAVGDGTTDDATAINNAIAALPAGGGIVLLPYTGNPYCHGSTLNLGNGTSSALSTTYGIQLVGVGGPPAYGMSNVGITTPPTTLKWIGAAGGTMVSVNGPLAGGGVSNIAFDGNSLASTGLKVVSAIGCQFNNLAFKAMASVGGSARCIWETTVAAFGGHLTNTMHNSWNNIFMAVNTASSGGSSTGILFDSADASANACYESWANVTFSIGTPASGTTSQAIAFKSADNIKMRDLHIASAGPGSGTINLLNFNYSGASTSWPADCLIDGVDFGPAANYTAIAVNSGTPSGSAGKNRVVCIGSTNSGGTPPASPGLTNLAWGYTAANP